MLKTFVLIIVSVAAAVHSYSQVNFGIKGGPGYVGFWGARFGSDKPLHNRSGRFAYHFGIYGNVPLTNSIILQSDLMYSNKGFKSPISKESLHYHYLSLPFLFRIKPFKKVYLIVGPEFSYMIAASYHTSSKNYNAIKEQWVTRFDVGAAAGIGYEFTEKLSAELRFIQGLRSPTDAYARFHDKFGDPLADFLVLNQAMQFSLCYQIKNFTKQKCK